VRLIFIDDSRQNSPSRPGMGPLVATGGLIVPAQNVRNLEASLNGACQRFGFPAGDARSINKPILLVTGQNSPRALVRMTDRLEELLPNTERVTIPNASHVMHYENPTATNKAILDFLGRQ
jgi:pimeloyl-ACP methyl ester carboxylesterase